MDARLLRTFLKTIELGSISRAADALGVAQPSLSQQILRLEDEVGAKLLRRTARGVATTEAGRIFEEHARHILRTIDQALEDIRQLSNEPSYQRLTDDLATMQGEVRAAASAWYEVGRG